MFLVTLRIRMQGTKWSVPKGCQNFKDLELLGLKLHDECFDRTFTIQG